MEVNEGEKLLLHQYPCRSPEGLETLNPPDNFLFELISKGGVEKITVS